MTHIAIDYAWQHVDPTTARRAGVDAVLRYLSTDGTKNLTAGERDAIHDAGLAIGLVWETTATRALAGQLAGHDDALAAAAAASALGMPIGCALYFAVDGDYSPEQVASYFDGVRMAGIPYALGVYGSLRVCESLKPHVVRYAWQTEAWSGPSVSGSADIYQRVAHTVHVPGAADSAYDEDVLISPDWGGWLPGAVPAPAAPTPQPVPGPRLLGGLPLTVDGNFGAQSVAAMQRADGQAEAQIDGAFGPLTRQAMQRHLGVTADGVVGPVTVRALQQHVGATVDGSWGAQTTTHVQEALNARRF